MKRAANTTNETVGKRKKASQACAACRKHKTRCEILNDQSQSGALQCHRCKVLNLDCSFESSRIIHLPPVNKPSPTTSTATASTSYQPAAVRTASAPIITTSSGERIPPFHVAPRPIAPEEVNQEFVQGAQKLQPEDLIPIPTCPWGVKMIGNFDWSVAPILAIQELAFRYCPPQALPPLTKTYSDTQLSDVLSHDQIKRLLDIFDTRYRPWLCLSPRENVTTICPLMDLVCCTVACRHLDPMTQTMVIPRLFHLVQSLFMTAIFNPVPTYDAIIALLILAKWAPISIAGGQENKDGRLLVASAASMAMNLQLESATSRLHSSNAKSYSEQQLRLTVEKAEIWILLTMTESILCLGTGRTPVSRRSEKDRRLIDLPCLSAIQRARNVRLSYITTLLDASEAGLSAYLQSPSEFGPFFSRINNVLAKFECIVGPIIPLYIVSEHDRFFFHMLLIQYNALKLLVCHHACRQMRIALHGVNGESWAMWMYNDMRVGMMWARDAVRCSELVLTHFLSAQDPTFLAAAPDYFFRLISFSTIFLIITNFTFYDLRGISLGNACERLITMTIERLSQISYSSEHAPAKYAHLTTALLNLWDKRPIETPVQNGPGCLSNLTVDTDTDCATGMHIDSAQTPSSKDTVSPVPLNDAANGSSGAFDNVARTSDSDIFDNPDFWTNFMQSFTTESDRVDNFGIPTSQFF